MFSTSLQGVFGKLKSAKLQVAYLLLALFCILFYWIDSLGGALPSWVPQFPPYKSLAEACLTTLMVSFIYEAWIRRESQAELHQSLLSPHMVRTNLDEATVRGLTKAGFQRMLQSEEFGEELFGYFTDLAFSANRRRYDVRTELTLLPLRSESAFSYNEEQSAFYFNLKGSLAYKKPIRTKQIWFRCVTRMESLREVIEDESTEWRWFVPQHRFFEHIDESFFRVSELEIDGQRVKISKKIESGQVSYFANVPKHVLDSPATRIRFKTEIKVRKTAQYIFTDVVHPVKDIIISFDVASLTEVKEAGAVPIFSSASRPKRDYLPTYEEPKKITVSVDGWSIPDSGVVFFWKLRQQALAQIEEKAR